MSKGECFDCKFEGKNCPNNLYSAQDIHNNHKRCSPNTQFSSTSDKFEPKLNITNNLTNEQIRVLLEMDLSKDELKVIATQRGISTVSTKEEIKRHILRNLERQENYKILLGRFYDK